MNWTEKFIEALGYRAGARNQPRIDRSRSDFGRVYRDARESDAAAFDRGFFAAVADQALSASGDAAARARLLGAK